MFVTLDLVAWYDTIAFTSDSKTLSLLQRLFRVQSSVAVGDALPYFSTRDRIELSLLSNPAETLLVITELEAADVQDWYEVKIM